MYIMKNLPEQETSRRCPCISIWDTNSHALCGRVPKPIRQDKAPSVCSQQDSREDSLSLIAAPNSPAGRRSLPPELEGLAFGLGVKPSQERGFMKAGCQLAIRGEKLSGELGTSTAWLRGPATLSHPLFS